MNTPDRALSLALALLPVTGLLSAQELRQIDQLAEGAPTGTVIDGQGGGAGWLGDWISVNQPAFLLGYYPLDSDATDQGFFSATGIPMGGAFSPDVPPGLLWSTGSLELNAATNPRSEYVELSSAAPLYQGIQIGTISAWFKTNASGVMTILAASDSTRPSSEVRLYIEGGLLHYDVRGDLQSLSIMDSVTAVVDDVWHHVAVVVEPNADAILYLDGTEEARLAQGFFRHVFHLDTMGIGRNVDSGGAQWLYSGKIDDLAIWGYPLSQSEVLDLAGGVRQPSSITGTPRIAGPVVDSASLTSPAFGSRGLTPQGGSVGDSSGYRAGRLLNPPFDLRVDETYYLSCLLRREDNGPIVAGDVDMAGNGAVRSSFGWDDQGLWRCGTRGANVGTTQMLDRTTYFCVLRVDAVASGADAAFLKVYGPNDTVDASDADFTMNNLWTVVGTAFASNGVNDALWITPRQPGGKMVVDEIRTGSSWDSVTRGSYGSACGGLTIGQIGRPNLGGASFGIELHNAAPGVPVACNLGVSRDVSLFGALPLDLAPFGAAGCFVLGSAEVGVGAAAGGSGGVTLPLGIPNSMSLQGQALFAQWIAVDPNSTNSLGLALSDGLEIVIQD